MSADPTLDLSLPEPVLGRAEIDELLAYHELVLRELAGRRTNLTSGLIPVREYIVLSNIECWHRWPGILAALDRTIGAEELGRRLRRPGSEVSAPYFWSIANLVFTGRTVRHKMGMLGDDEIARLSVTLDVWRRATAAWRGDGFVQAWDAGDAVRPFGEDVIAALTAGAEPVGEVDGERHTQARRFLATLMQYLFLLYLDTRMGTGDSGPYPLPGGRTMIVREFSALDGHWMPWADVAAGVPHRNLLCGLVFRPGVQNRVTDFATTASTPVDNLLFLERLAVFDAAPDGTLTPVPWDDLAGILAAVKQAQADFYRRVARWSFTEKVDAGAYVYFRGLMRPFTVAAGIDDRIDWTVPRDATDFVPFLELLPPDDTIGDEPIFPLLGD